MLLVLFYCHNCFMTWVTCNTQVVPHHRRMLFRLYYAKNSSSTARNTLYSMLPLILSTSRSELCLKFFGRPWYSSIIGSKTAAKSLQESSSPAQIPQCWSLNSTAQAMAWARVNPEVLVLMSASFSHVSGDRCFATKLLAERMVGNGGVAGYEKGLKIYIN